MHSFRQFDRSKAFPARVVTGGPDMLVSRAALRQGQRERKRPIPLTWQHNPCLLPPLARPKRRGIPGKSLQMSSVYRTHTCGQLRPEHVGEQARLSGWVQRKRDHGNLLFIDLRDHYGVTQVVVDVSSPVFKTAETVRNE